MKFVRGGAGYGGIGNDIGRQWDVASNKSVNLPLGSQTAALLASVSPFSSPLVSRFCLKKPIMAISLTTSLVWYGFLFILRIADIPQHARCIGGKYIDI